MAAAWDIDETEEVNENCILMANLQQASTLGTQTDKSPVYDPDRSAEVHHSENCYDNDILNMYTQKEQYIELLEPITKPHQAQQNKSNVISKVPSVEQSGGTVEQQPATITKDELAPIVNQVDGRVQNFKNHFVKEATKFVRDFKSLAKDADESLDKILVLEKENEHLLRVVVSQDIMSIVQNHTDVETSDLQKGLDLTKEKLETSYNNMQHKIERLQGQLGDHKGKSKDTQCALDTLEPLSQKLEDENVSLEFQVSEQKDTTKIHPKVVELNDLSNPVTSNSVPTTNESKVVKNNKVIVLGMFRINHLKTSRKDKFVPINQARASVRTKPITISQPCVITKHDVNSDSTSLSSTGVDNTANTRRPQPRSNTKNDRVPSASKSCCIKSKEVKVKENHRYLLLSKNKKHMSFECNNIKLAIQNDKYEVICAIFSNTANQKKHKAKVKKSKKLASKERLALPKPSKPRLCLRWSPTRRIFDCSGKLIESNDFECQFESSKGCPNLFMFLGTFEFGNDHITAILGYGDLQWGNILIVRVYYVEGLGYNMFSVGQFCDLDLDVAFKSVDPNPGLIP
ncbi:hypothetical protein Tco_0665121 [Tanacetum coccineum]